MTFLDLLKGEVGNTLESIIPNNSVLKESDGIVKVMDWYQEVKNTASATHLNLQDIREIPGVINSAMIMKNEPDPFYSKISSWIVPKLLELLPFELLKVIVHDISIMTQGKQKGIKFDATLEPRSIYYYVDFVKVVNGVDVIKTRIHFETKAEITLKGIQLLSSTAGERRASVESLLLNLIFYLRGIGTSSIIKDKKLGNREFEINLSGHDVSLENQETGQTVETQEPLPNVSSLITCPHCGNPTRSDGKFCTDCGEPIEQEMT